MERHYGQLSLEERCQIASLQAEGRSIRQIFGSPDDLKFRSSMTLFAHAKLDNRVFLNA